MDTLFLNSELYPCISPCPPFTFTILVSALFNSDSAYPRPLIMAGTHHPSTAATLSPLFLFCSDTRVSQYSHLLVHSWLTLEPSTCLCLSITLWPSVLLITSNPGDFLFSLFLLLTCNLFNLGKASCWKGLLRLYLTPAVLFLYFFLERQFLWAPFFMKN